MECGPCDLAAVLHGTDVMSGDRDRDLDRDRERDSIFRLRERTRWLDSALREETGMSRLDHDRADGLLGIDSKKSSAQPNPLSFAEGLQFWVDKVRWNRRCVFN